MKESSEEQLASRKTEEKSALKGIIICTILEILGLLFLYAIN
ncbi:MAG: hypothetical protein Q8891_11115 [Bacteroidota bacterium]|nr:hypothetical protein [Bacteroidota bacterium]